MNKGLRQVIFFVLVETIFSCFSFFVPDLMKLGYVQAADRAVLPLGNNATPSVPLYSFSSPEPAFRQRLFKTTEEVEVFLGTNHPESLKTTVIDSRGQKVPTKARIKGENLKFAVPDNFRPRKYTIKATDGTKVVPEQDFNWGVLAINTNKSIYRPQEIAYLQLAVLDDGGHALCNTQLKLEIKNPASEITTLTTAEGRIKNSETCSSNNVTDSPDYFAYYEVHKTGTYQMKLINLDNGYEISDSFAVQENLPVEVERVGATRINPSRVSYTLTITVKANQDFSGTVEETVPAVFEIESQGARVTAEDKNSKKVLWQAVWRAGEKYQLRYTYRAPGTSPQFYLLGPIKFIENDPSINGSTGHSTLRVSDSMSSPSLEPSRATPRDSGSSRVKSRDGKSDPLFSEVRRWQIAADAPSTIVDSQSGSGTRAPAQRKVVRTTNGASGKRTFAIGFTGLALNLYYCDDPEAGSPSWSTAGTLISSATLVVGELVWDEANNVLYVAYGREAPSNSDSADIFYRRISTLNDTPTLGAQQTVFDGSSGGTTYQHPAVEIAQDASTLKVFVFGSVGASGGNSTGIVLRTSQSMNADAPTWDDSFTVKSWVAASTSGIMGVTRMNTDKLAVLYFDGADVFATRHDDSADAHLNSGWDALDGTDNSQTMVSNDHPGRRGVGSAVGMPTSDIVWFAWLDVTGVINTRRWNGTGLDTEMAPVATTDLTVGPALTTDGANLYMIYRQLNDTTILVYQTRAVSDGTSAWSGSETTLEDSSENLNYPSVAKKLYQGKIDVIYTTGTEYYIRHMSSYKVSGNVYQESNSSLYEGTIVWSGCDGLTQNIGLSFNGGTKVNTLCSSSDGSFYFVLPTPGATDQTITVFLDTNGGDKGGVYTHNNDTITDITNITLYKDRVWIQSESASAITNTQINTYDQSNDSDIPIVSDGTDATVDSGVELHINTGDTFAPAGSVSTPKLHIKGTYTGASETLTLSGAGNAASCDATEETIRPLCIDGGTFTPTTNTVTFTATGASNVENTTYYNLTFNGNTTFTGLATTTINNALTIATSTAVFAMSTNNLIVGSTSVANSGSIKVAGTVSQAASATTTIKAASGSNCIGATGASCIGTAGTIGFYNLTIGNSSNTFQTNIGGTGTTFTAAGNLTVTASSTLALGAYSIAVGNVSDANSGSIKIAGILSQSSSGTVTVLSASGTNCIGANGADCAGAPGTIGFYNLTIGNSSNTFATNIGGTSPTVTIAGVLNITTNTTLRPNATTTITLSGAGTPITRAGTFDAATNPGSTVQYTSGTGITALASAVMTTTNAFHHLTISGTGSFIANVNFTTNGALTIGNGTNAETLLATTNNPIIIVIGAFTINNAGTFTGGSSNLTVQGDFTLNSASTYTKGSGTLILDGGTEPSPQYFDDKNATKQNMGTVQIGTSPAVTRLKSDMTADSLTIASGDTLYTQGWDLDIATFVIVNSTGTLNCTDSGGPNNEGNGTNINLGTNWTVASDATFTAQESETYPTAVIFDESSNGNITPGGTDESHDFYNFTVTKSATSTLTLVGAIDVENDLTISNAASTLDTGTNYAINVAGNWSNSGTFTANSGTVTFNGGDSTTQALSGNTTFYNFTASTNSNTAGRTLRFTGGSSTTGVSGTWTITGYSSKVITLQSSNTNSWTINPAVASVTYVNVSRSTNTGVYFCATYSNDGGNNSGWTITGGVSCNQNPDPPTLLAQYKSDCSTSLSAGGWTGETSVCLKGDISDPDSLDQVKLQVEVVTGSFSNSPTNIAASYCTAPCTSSVTVTGLSGGSQYKWQARSIDDDSTTSSWNQFNSANIAFGVDITAPTCAISSIDESSDYAYASGSTIYYNSNYTGSFTVNVTASNGQSGIQKVNFPDTVSAGGDDTSSLYSFTYTWDTSDTFSQIVNVICYNNTGEAMTASFTITRDITAPTGTTLGFGTITASSITAIVSGSTDSQSGLDATPYYFDRNSGSAFSNWQSSTSWQDSGLLPNTQYAYKVKSRDKVLNQSDYTVSQNKYTLANFPLGLTLTANSDIQITGSWHANGNSAGTEYFIENITNGTNSGWITETSSAFSNLSASSQYAFRVKARNGDGISTDFCSGESAATEGAGGGVIPLNPSLSTTCQGNILENLGGQVWCSLKSGEITKAIFPPDKIKGTAVVQIIPLNKTDLITAKPLPKNNKIIGDLAVEIKALSEGKEIKSFEGEISIIFTYGATRAKNLQAVKTNIWDETSKTWKPLATKVDPVKYTATSDLNKPSLIVVTEEAVEEFPKGMSIEEIKAKINEILARISELQLQLNQQTTSEIPTGYKFVTFLYLGQQGANVKYLQLFLKQQGDDIYPEGLVTGYFGQLTKKAVTKFQLKYKLIKSSEDPAAGYLGPKTRAKINEILSSFAENHGRTPVEFHLAFNSSTSSLSLRELLESERPRSRRPEGSSELRTA